MAKRAREQAVAEKRARKAEKKRARKAAAADGQAAPDGAVDPGEGEATETEAEPEVGPEAA